MDHAAGRRITWFPVKRMPTASATHRPEPSPLSDLFTSGAYVDEFHPEAATNPFHALYEAKRAWIVESVSGVDQRILDVGGAMGRMAIPLAEKHDVTLCDLSHRMLGLARASATRPLKLAVADMLALPFASASFDYVLCIDVLPHVANPEPGLAEIKRVLRPGGALIIDSTNSNPLWTLAYPRYLGRRPGRWFKVWRSSGVLPEWSHRIHHRGFTEFEGLLQRAGFQIRRRQDFGPVWCPKWHLVQAEAL